jgi:glutamine synthetase
MKTAKDVLKAIKDNDVKYVDFRFTDPKGKWQHVTFDVSMIDEEIFAEGTMFDGSSISGWKAINESDMMLMPDPSTATIDPFFAASTMSIVCDVLEPTTGEPYERDPRGIAKKAEAYLKSTGIGDTIYVGPEAEFFVFDDVKFMADPYNTGFKLDAAELPTNGDTDYEGGNLGHRVAIKGGYFPVPPQDTAQDMRGEMLAAMASMGMQVEKHHHEVASAQHELGMKFDTLVRTADMMQVYKYCIHNVAQSVHAEAGVRRQWLGHARAPVDLEEWQAGVRWQQIRRPQPGMPVVHWRRHQARQGAERLHQPVDELLQASRPGL